MKKLLLSGFTAVALMAAGTAQAGGLDLMGGTGVARTPLAMSLAPMQFAVAADYVFSEDTFIPMRAAIGLPMGFEVGGYYWYEDIDIDPTVWGVGAKYVLPKFVEGLGLAVGGHYEDVSTDIFDATAYDLYAVATYPIPMGEGMSLIPSAGAKWVKVDVDDVGDEDGFKFFGSLLFKMDKFAVGGELISTDEDLDGPDADPSYWVGGRFFLNPMVTFQGGYLNYADVGGTDPKDGVFHVGVQLAFGGAK